MRVREQLAAVRDSNGRRVSQFQPLPEVLVIPMHIGASPGCKQMGTNGELAVKLKWEPEAWAVDGEEWTVGTWTVDWIITELQEMVRLMPVCRIAG